VKWFVNKNQHPLSRIYDIGLAASQMVAPDRDQAPFLAAIAEAFYLIGKRNVAERTLSLAESIASRGSPEPASLLALQAVAQSYKAINQSGKAASICEAVLSRLELVQNTVRSANLARIGVLFDELGLAARRDSALTAILREADEQKRHLLRSLCLAFAIHVCARAQMNTEAEHLMEQVGIGDRAFVIEILSASICDRNAMAVQNWAAKLLHPSAIILTNLAGWEAHSGRTTEALRRMQEASDTALKAQGLEATYVALSHVAYGYAKLGEKNKALHFLRKLPELAGDPALASSSGTLDRKALEASALTESLQDTISRARKLRDSNQRTSFFEWLALLNVERGCYAEAANVAREGADSSSRARLFATMAAAVRTANNEQASKAYDIFRETFEAIS